MTKEIVKDHINADNVTVQRLDPKQLYPETLNYVWIMGVTNELVIRCGSS